MGGTPPLAASVAGRADLQALFADPAGPGPWVGEEIERDLGF